MSVLIHHKAIEIMGQDFFYRYGGENSSSRSIPLAGFHGGRGPGRRGASVERDKRDEADGQQPRLPERGLVAPDQNELLLFDADGDDHPAADAELVL